MICLRNHTTTEDNHITATSLGELRDHLGEEGFVGTGQR